jgi:hypothetical protein
MGKTVDRFIHSDFASKNTVHYYFAGHIFERQSSQGQPKAVQES